MRINGFALRDSYGQGYVFRHPTMLIILLEVLSRHLPHQKNKNSK